MPKSFRNTMTSDAGTDPALCLEGRVVDVNMKNWTVDVASSFDQKTLNDIQVGSPYVHFNNGEGVYCMPDVGAVCKVMIPSDTTAPFVMCFVMPMEVVASDGGVQGSVDDVVVTGPDGVKKADPSAIVGGDAPTGTVSRSSTGRSTDASFYGGRPDALMGDIVMRTRDDNFLILHRGGVVQIGASEIAQRIFLPIGNFIEDISGNYAHRNTGGTIQWGLQDITPDDAAKSPTRHMEVYRVWADDKYADIRVTHGNAFGKEPAAEGSISGNIVYDFVIAPGGFDANTGDYNKQPIQFRQTFDDAGNALMKGAGDMKIDFSGEVLISPTKSLILRSIGPAGGITIETLIRDIVVRALKGDIDIKTLIGNIALTTLLGSIDMRALGGITMQKTDGVPVEPLPMGIQLLAWLATHTHVMSSPPVQAGALAGILSTTVKISK